ncbi:MAG: DUF4238 domain-containing protein [Actinomycetota bacterium]
MRQRHHLVPRFYLDRWSIPGKGLTAVRRSSGEVLSRSARTVAVETDAYAIEVPDEGKNYIVERMLGAVESEGAQALSNMLESWPPSEKDRESWALLMAFQVTRGRDFMDDMNKLEVYMTKTMVALDSRDPESMRRRLQDAGLEPTQDNMDLLREMMDKPDSYNLRVHPAHLLKTAMETGRDMLPYVAARTWNLLHFEQPVLITTDRPLTLHSEPESRGPFGAVGLMTADEVWMPLDPTRLLVMTHPDTEPRVGTVPQAVVPSISLRIAAACNEWVVARPENPHVSAIAQFLKGRPGPTLEIAGPSLEEWSKAGERMTKSLRSAE